MVAVRRLYFLLVAGVSLGMLVTGAATLGSTLIEWALSPGSITATFRQTIAGSTAAALVALPIWALHWALAQRAAARSPAEREAALRRLYLYVVCGALMAAIGFIGARALHLGLLLLIRDSGGDAVGLVRALWQLALVGAFWGYHLDRAAKDRSLVGETGASATLRRWYAYGAVLVSVVVVLFGARELLTVTMLAVTQSQPAESRHVVRVVARTLVALGIGLYHAHLTARLDEGEEERRSTLRAVAGFGILALGIAMALTQTSRALYYLLARALGVEAPGGARGEIGGLLASPLSTIAVFGLAWALVRRRLIADARQTEAPRQAGVRRLYTHLVTLIALAAFTAGVAGVLWTIIEAVDPTSALVGPTSTRDRLSLFLTLVVVGLPVWAGHWRPAPSPGERQALSRRLYLFAALLIGVLALLGSGAYLVERVLSTIMGVGPPALWSAVARALAVTVVAAAVVAYHFRVLRLDAATRAAEPGPGQFGTFQVEIVGASASEVAAALARLPSGARYTIRTADGADAAGAEGGAAGA